MCLRGRLGLERLLTVRARLLCVLAPSLTAVSMELSKVAAMSPAVELASVMLGGAVPHAPNASLDVWPTCKSAKNVTGDCGVGAHGYEDGVTALENATAHRDGRGIQTKEESAPCATPLDSLAMEMNAIRRHPPAMVEI